MVLNKPKFPSKYPSYSARAPRFPVRVALPSPLAEALMVGADVNPAPKLDTTTDWIAPMAICEIWIIALLPGTPVFANIAFDSSIPDSTMIKPLDSNCICVSALSSVSILS